MEKRSELSRRYATALAGNVEGTKKGVETPDVAGTFDFVEELGDGARRRDVLSLKAVLETEIDYSFRGLFVSDARNEIAMLLWGENGASRDPD